MRRETRIEVAAVVRHLARQPRRPAERLIFRVQLDFGDHEAGVVAEELIHFPLRALVRDDVAVLLDDRPVAELQELLGIGLRDLVLELGARGAL